MTVDYCALKTGRPTRMSTPCLELMIFWINLYMLAFLSAIYLASGYHQVGLAKDA